MSQRTNIENSHRNQIKRAMERYIKQRYGEEKAKHINFWDEVVKIAVKEPSVLVALLKKVAPDLSKLDADVTNRIKRLVIESDSKDTKEQESKPESNPTHNNNHSGGGSKEGITKENKKE